MVSSRLAKRQGFTLIELMVVVAITAILVALLMVGYYKVRSVADRVTTVNNLYNVGVALTNYHSTNKVFPTEVAPSSGEPRVSLYKQLLSFVDAKNAPDDAPIRVYTSPSRRAKDTPKRDFGYASSQANGSAGPTVFDDQVGPVSMAKITEGGKSVAETALLSMVWLAPQHYAGGDGTDAGWAVPMNSRANLQAIKKDSDQTGDNSFLGGPYESGVPTLFADNHISVVPYTTKQSDWAVYWAYNTTMTRTCEAWLPPSNGEEKACTCGSPACQCGCAKDGGQADTFDPYDVDDIKDMLRKKAQNDYLTPEEEELLKNLDKSAYDKYKDKLKNEKSNWEKSVKDKAERGEQLTPEEQKYHDKTVQDQKNKKAQDDKNAENAKKNAEKKKFDDDAIKKGDEGKEELTPEEKAVYDGHKKKQADDAANKKKAEEKAKWQQDTMNKGKNGEDMTKEEKNYYDGEVKKQEDKKQNDWKKSVENKGNKGETLTKEEQDYYDQYQDKQSKQKAQQEADAKKKEEDYQKKLQDQLNQYGDKLGGPQDTTPGGPCNCGFSCCAPGTCKCSH